MAGLVPAIHVLRPCVEEGVDARHKAGHDEREQSHSPIAIRFALPPAAAVLMVTVCSVAKRRR
ncbi:hypothetical protein DC522_01820 [Microvirga sp. KLBC 81]|nr:hypothetical protein DC522_01820 [Microvirga sp. KLBC 81]